MTKNKLWTGMVVETRDGSRYLVLTGELTTTFYGNQRIILVNMVGFQTLEHYTNILEFPSDSNFDIVKVFTPDIHSIKNILSTTDDPLWVREPEVDWSKVAVDTKVYVRDGDGDEWYPRYFKEYRGGEVHTWNDGATSFSSDTSTSWDQARLA